MRFRQSGCLFLAALGMIHVGSVRAQDYPTITINATDPQAVETGSDPGTFTVLRTGGTNFSQLIFYVLSGTASNGVDYQQLENTVQMPAGATAVSITVTPISDSLVEGTESVVAQIVASPLDCVTCGYDIGQPDTAEIQISDNPPPPLSGLYAINSGDYGACCGLGGDLGYDLPDPAQTFVRLEVDPQNNTASMAFLRDDAQTVFSIVPCPSTGNIPFSFDYGFISKTQIFFHVDPGPQSYWNYTVSFSADTLRIDGILGLTQHFCADSPTKFTHSNVVATLVAPPPRIEGVQRQGANIRFHFIGEPPYDYFVEATDLLAPLNWHSVTNFRAKLSTIEAVFSDPVTNSATRFYRIRKQPCFCR